jgi:rSAM-associated Gly-rich repeat protein
MISLVLRPEEIVSQLSPEVGYMKKSNSIIAVALQIAACVGLLPKDAKANPAVTANGDSGSIRARVAKVRQMLSQAATDQLGATKEVDGVRVNWWNWHKWGKGGWGKIGPAWGNGGWGNGGFHPRHGWGNGGWGNGGWGKIGWHKWGNL